MGNYSVPESIRKQKPKGTMVKNISGHYYVYEYSCYIDETGKRRTKMGKAIGSIKEGIGFVSNDAFNTSSSITTIDYGEYAITLANTRNVLELLKESFNAQDAVTIYVISIIHFIQGFTYLKDIKLFYDMSYLSIKYPALKMGYNALSKLYDSLGRRQSRVLDFQQKLISSSSHQIAIDGHVLACESDENDLAEKGYKFCKLGESQINLLMAYDVNTHIPLMSRIYEGASPDKISVKDFVDQVELKNMLFIIDRGFYSSDNIRLFSNNGNAYIIPLASNLNTCKKAVHSLEMHDRFLYQKGKKATVVEYKDEIIDGYRVITYRDLSEAAALQENYLRHMNQGDKNYTKEGFEKNKYFFGVTVLQTCLEDETPKEIYTLYKKRWSIEVFYNYFKNQAGYSALHETDYYKTQGLSFIMLVSALIYHEMNEVAKTIKGKSLASCMLEARMVKANKRHGNWSVSNCLKKQVDLFGHFNTPVQIGKC